MEITHHPRRVIKASTTIKFDGAAYPHLWHHNADYSVALNDDVLEWLSKHAPGFRVLEPDRGDWGEGTPIYSIIVRTKDVAEAFARTFTKK